MRFWRSIAAPVVGIAAFLVLWQLVVEVFDAKPFVLLPPSEILAEFLRAPGFYLRNMAVTGQEMVIGLTLALVVSIVVGAVMAASRFVEEATQPVLVLILVTPWVAYVTSVVIWFGLDGSQRAVLFMVAFTTFPILTFGVVGGLKAADPAARELLASVDASWWEVLWRLRLPSALPSMFTTARMASALGLAAAYFSEGPALQTDGLGAIGRRAAAFNNGDILWTTIACTAALGIIALMLISVLERIVLRWHVSQRNAVH